jgi:hypothetical protein
MIQWLKDRFGIGWTKWFVRSLFGKPELLIPNRKRTCPICSLLHISSIWCRYHLVNDRIQYKCHDCCQVWEETMEDDDGRSLQSQGMPGAGGNGISEEVVMPEALGMVLQGNGTQQVAPERSTMPQDGRSAEDGPVGGVAAQNGQR